MRDWCSLIPILLYPIFHQLSYFFIFDHTVDWDVSLMIVYVAAMTLWLHCSLIYMAAFFYELSVVNKMEQEDADFALEVDGKDVDSTPHSTMEQC